VASHTVSEKIASAMTSIGTRGLAEAMADLIRSGELLPGQRLPAIRLLAEELDLSPTTVASAWSQLSSQGWIEPRGRRGTFVATRIRRSGATRRWSVAETNLEYKIDLSTGVPDPKLLPDLRSVMAKVEFPEPSSYLDPPVLDELKDAILARLPESILRADLSLTVVNGALDALDRLLSLIPRTRSRIICEEPAFPALYDLVENHGFDVRPVPLDQQGMIPEHLSAELASNKVAAVILQPRAQNPTGVSLSADRRDQLAEILKRHPHVMVFEDDHSGLICSTPLNSLGAKLKEQVVYILSFSKSHGPDLRIAAVVGGVDLIEELNRARCLGPAWTSKLIQKTIATMLTDPNIDHVIEQAKATYAKRREALSKLFQTPSAITGDGINLWLEDNWDLSLIVHLAHEHIRVTPGSNFYYSPGPRPYHLRATLADPQNPFEEVELALTAALARLSVTTSFR
jgi:DNA-binding transcriptional MocR family regulator